MQRRTATKAKSTNFMPLIIVVSVVAAVCALVYSYVVFKNAYTVFPEKVYAENFSTPRDRIKGLIGGGDISSYYDIWLRFDCPDTVHLSATDWVLAQTPSRVAEWWRTNHPEEQGTQEYKDLDCWTLYRHPDLVTIANGTFLYNHKMNRYWFRIWGRK